MQRLTIDVRPDWQAKVEKLGLTFHSAGGAYWDESVCYHFTAPEIHTLETATNALHQLCLEAVQRVIDQRLFNFLGIPRRFVPLIITSWKRGDPSLYGRFDFFFDGRGAPKMYEYNADTPTALLEAGVVQQDWLREYTPEAQQFNSIHEKLVARWPECVPSKESVHFACARNYPEDFETTTYLEKTASEAGLPTRHLFMDEIGVKGRRFVDLQKIPITRLFKLYPWEWMIDEEFGVYLKRDEWQAIEPPWKMILSNKLILPLLWQMFPDHPNLLPAYTTPYPLGGSYVRKPAHGREGANVTIVSEGKLVGVETPGSDPDGEFIYQALLPLPDMNGFRPVVGSWIVGDRAAGIGIRESTELVTQHTSRFVPHYFTP